MTSIHEGSHPAERTEGNIQVNGGKVWYETFGDLKNKTPIIVVHGGPGWPKYLDPLSQMSTQFDRPVIFYDQLGCGNSDKPTDTSLWTLDRSVAELRDIMSAFKDQYGVEDFHLLGHSYGAAIVLQLASEENAKVIKSITLASPLINSNIFIQDTLKLISSMPDSDEFLKLIKKFENGASQEDPDHKRYLELVGIFEANFVYGSALNHPAVLRSEAEHNDDVYNTMWGPFEFSATGNLRDLDLIPTLSSSSTPILITGGGFDEVRPETLENFKQATQNPTLIIYRDSAHMPHLEEGQKYMADLEEFLKHTELTSID